MAGKHTTLEEARRVGDLIGVDWKQYDLEQFRAGMDVEFEHGAHDPQTNVTHDDPIVTGKIAFAHMKEFPDYYTRLAVLEFLHRSLGEKYKPAPLLVQHVKGGRLGRKVGRGVYDYRETA